MNKFKNFLFIIVAIIVVLLVVAWYQASPGGIMTGGNVLKGMPTFTQDEQLGAKEITDGQKMAAQEYKSKLLEYAQSGKVFTLEEKTEIGRMMLTEAHLYSFTDEEREAVFSALRRQ